MLILRAVLFGMLVMLAGTIPRNVLFAANLRYLPRVPWAVPLVAAFLWVFWRYLGGSGPPEETALQRRASLRARRLSRTVWAWALLAGAAGIVALVLALRVANRLVTLPPQRLPDLGQLPDSTVVALLMMAAPVAGIVEEAAFRGYILPAVVLHTAGNLHSNFDLWLHRQAEWQASAAGPALVWKTGADASFWGAISALLAVAAAAAWAFVHLARAARRSEGPG